MRRVLMSMAAAVLLAAGTGVEAEMAESVPEAVYRGELLSYPGPWAFEITRAHIILVSDWELEELANPDAKLDFSPWEKEVTLRTICERAKAQGQRTLVLAFDHFFSQYRPGQDKPRTLTPDMDRYVELIAGVSKFAQQYGLGLELSLLSPLEIGPAYSAATGESGRWLHYRKGLRDPETGAFSVQLWRQDTWANNKGVIHVREAGVRVFAFKEDGIYGTPYRAVDPREIVEITDGVEVEEWPSLRTGNGCRIRVHGRGHTDIGDLNRVLVVQQYETPEVDYFSPRALPYLTALVDKYVDAGVRLNALYSDEMHIQQDWNYFGHHDNGEFALRYVTDNLSRRFAQLYGAQFADLTKYMVYFAYGQEDTASDLTARGGAMHVFAASPEGIAETALFRARYYRLLQDGVVDLFTAAKRHAERRLGHKLQARAHATWAESPTIDYWDCGRENMNRHKYEYTSNFIWSDTVHQAAAACYDYFKWGDFLTGNGNDTAEGGWLDRNYLAPAQACSTGILNEVPYSYAAAWGHPWAIQHRRGAVHDIFGADASPFAAIVEDNQHRDVDVLMLYPIDLVAVEERFGSWVNQYGYANQVTQAKLIERGRVAGGALEMAGRRFTTLVATFEPFPSRKLLEMMREMVEGGGRVIWSGPPPILTAEGGDARSLWSEIFGVDHEPSLENGRIAAGRQVTFEGPLTGVTPQVILTDFLVDRVYPVTPRDGIAISARSGEWTLGTLRRVSSGGTAAYLGYRPRDDQSASLGYESRNWFEVLSALGAYPPTGAFSGINDNTEHISRTTGYLACRFPNGATAICPHLKDIEEDWDGNFVRNQEYDDDYTRRNPPPSDAISLQDFRVNGHRITFEGNHAVAFRLDRSGSLVAFTGSNCREITVDGRTTTFSEQPIGTVAWAPVAQERAIEGGAVWMFIAHGAGSISIPSAALPAESMQLVAQGSTPGSRGPEVESVVNEGQLQFTVTPELSGRWIYGIPR